MKKTVYIWLGAVWLCPALAFSGGLGSLERQSPASQHLDHQAKEVEQSLSRYRYEGSLWRDTGSDFYMDTKARRVSDILTIKIDEMSNASQQMSTKTSRDSSILGNIFKFFGSPLDFGLENLWGKDDEGNDIPFQPEISSSAQSSHSGSGKISGSDKLTARITAKVIDVMPNGNLLIEGRKEVTFDKEKRFILLSGIVRPEDIEFDNTVLSSRIADARIEYSGTGVVSDKQKPGVFHRLFDLIYPL
jgi:flagellar L-ring protein precursor FlgH